MIIIETPLSQPQIIDIEIIIINIIIKYVRNKILN